MYRCIEIPGLNIPIQPRIVEYNRRNLFILQLYAQDKGLVILNSSEINTVANFLENEYPDPKWVEWQAKKLRIGEETIRNTYVSFRGDIKRYLIVAGELLTFPPYSERIINPDLKEKNKPVLLRGYEIFERNEKDYIMEGGEVIEADWPKKDGIIPKDLARSLNASDATYVDKLFQGERENLLTLHWDFRSYPPRLFLSNPWIAGSLFGSIIGRDTEGFVRISRFQYQKLVRLEEMVSRLNSEWQQLFYTLHLSSKKRGKKP